MFCAEFSGHIQKSNANPAALVWNDVSYQTIRRNQGQNTKHKFCVYGHIWDKMWTQWVPFGVTSEVGFWWFLIILTFCWILDISNLFEMIFVILKITQRWWNFIKDFLRIKPKHGIFLFLVLSPQVFIMFLVHNHKQIVLLKLKMILENFCNHGPSLWPGYM